MLLTCLRQLTGSHFAVVASEVAEPWDASGASALAQASLVSPVNAGDLAIGAGFALGYADVVARASEAVMASQASAASALEEARAADLSSAIAAFFSSVLSFVNARAIDVASGAFSASSKEALSASDALVSSLRAGRSVAERSSAAEQHSALASMSVVCEEVLASDDLARAMGNLFALKLEECQAADNQSAIMDAFAAAFGAATARDLFILLGPANALRVADALALALRRESIMTDGRVAGADAGRARLDRIAAGGRTFKA